MILPVKLTSEVTSSRHEVRDLKKTVVKQSLELRLLDKSMIEDGRWSPAFRGRERTETVQFLPQIGSAVRNNDSSLELLFNLSPGNLTRIKVHYRIPNEGSADSEP